MSNMMNVADYDWEYLEVMLGTQGAKEYREALERMQKQKESQIWVWCVGESDDDQTTAFMLHEFRGDPELIKKEVAKAIRDPHYRVDRSVVADDLGEFVDAQIEEYRKRLGLPEDRVPTEDETFTVLGILINVMEIRGSGHLTEEWE